MRKNVRNVFYMVYLVCFMSSIIFIDGEIIQVLNAQCDMYVTFQIFDNGGWYFEKNLEMCSVWSI